MNKNEQLTFEKYAKLGIPLNKKGWPDFYYFSDGKLTVIETKAGDDDLSFEQMAIRDFLVKHGVKYIIEYAKDGKSETVFDSKPNDNRSEPHQPIPCQSSPFHPISDRASPNHSKPTNITHANRATPNQPVLAQTNPRSATPDPLRPDRATLALSRSIHAVPAQPIPTNNVHANLATSNQTAPFQAKPFHPIPNHATPHHSNPTQPDNVHAHLSEPHLTSLGQSSPPYPTPIQSRPFHSTPTKSKEASP